jgi:hypothetical protein
MRPSIEGLTQHQVELLDAMWACDTFEEYETFIDLLDEEDRHMADLLQKVLIMECLDNDMAQETQFPEANQLLDKFKK